MKASNITNNSFRALIEPHKSDYSTKQEKLASQVRVLLSNINPDDKKGRTYADYYNEDFGLDLYIKPVKENNSIDVLTYDKVSNSFEQLYNYKKIIPKESDFLMFAQHLKEDSRDFIEKIITYSVILLTFGLMFLFGNKSVGAQNIEKIKKIELIKPTKELENVASTFMKKI